jgi:hypothetical protein
MAWVIGILALLVLIICLLLLSIIILEVDTRVPQAALRWGVIANAKIWYAGEWWLKLQFPFYRKTFRIADMKSKRTKRKAIIEKEKPKKRRKLNLIIKKIYRVIKSFQVSEWKLALDSGNYVTNAQIYPLNFFPKVFKHLFINFNGENYLVLKVSNRAWKMLYNYLK